MKTPSRDSVGEIPIVLKPWPRLSAAPGLRHPRRCQRCSAEWDLQWWEECDDYDVPENILVILCLECSEKIIEPHPRLYRLLDENMPLPGAMVICHDCKHRDGLKCKCPRAKFNGGPGMKVVHSVPQRMFMDGTKNGKPWGEVVYHYDSKPSDCDGFNQDEVPNGDDKIIPLN